MHEIYYTMTNKFILAFGCIAFLVSCETTSHDYGIELDNGQKWKVNPEMMPPIQASIQAIKAFEGQELNSYKELAKILGDNNQTLISSCTMTGKSHDELHKWLHPYIGMVDKLANAKNQKVAASHTAYLCNIYPSSQPYIYSFSQLTQNLSMGDMKSVIQPAY